MAVDGALVPPPAIAAAVCRLRRVRDVHGNVHALPLAAVLALLLLGVFATQRIRLADAPGEIEQTHEEVAVVPARVALHPGRQGAREGNGEE